MLTRITSLFPLWAFLFWVPRRQSHFPAMLLPALLEGERKFFAIWYMILPQSPKAAAIGQRRSKKAFILAVVLVLLTFVGHQTPADETSGESDALFPRPAAIAPAIRFWTRIFSEIDSAAGFIHDNRRLDVVYRTLYLNPHAAHASQSVSIARAVAQQRKTLLALAAGKRSGLSREERDTLAHWGEDVTAEGLAAAAERLRFQRGQADRFQDGLHRAERWRRRIEAIFRHHGLPLKLVALPHVESSYNPRVRSSVGAAGLWQLMPGTGRRYLRVDALVDERLDPYRSTEAAALFLKQNYKIVKSWPLAITAYNHGLSGIRRAQREVGSDDIGVITASYKGHRFGFASRNFYAAFLAAADIDDDPARFFVRPGASTRLRIPTFLPVEVIAEAFGTRVLELRRFNPNLHHAVFNGDQFVPKGALMTLPAQVAPVQGQAILGRLVAQYGFSAQKPYRSYDVIDGDSLSMIAQRHNTTVGALMRMNSLTSPHQIRAGKWLRVPPGALPRPLGPGAASMLEDELALLLQNPTDVEFPEGLDDRDRSRAATEAMGVGSGADPCLPHPTTGTGTESLEIQGTVLTEAQPELAADPVDYTVAADGTIEIQIDETLGHYADWLELHSDDLNRRNDLGPDKQLIVGNRLRLDFSRVTHEQFEQRRLAHHKTRQLRYFERHRISEVIEHRIRGGDNLWLLAIKRYQIPMWLLRQYNPDIEVDTVLALDDLVYVPLVEWLPEPMDCQTRQPPPQPPQDTSSTESSDFGNRDADVAP